MSVTTEVTRKRTESMAKKNPGRRPVGKQTGVRLPAELQAILQEIGDGMGLDLSSVMRMILTEQHEEYLRRVRQRKQHGEQKETPADAEQNSREET